MANGIIEFKTRGGNSIDIAALKQSRTRKLAEGIIAPSVEQHECELAPEHAADPIKSIDDIDRISTYLIGEGRYRDNMLFILGINFGLRVSDLRLLRFSNLINENFTFKDSFPVFETKTRNTRKRKKNRYITINTAVMEAVTIFLENTPGVCLSDYMFTSNSNHNKGGAEPLTRGSIDTILKNIARDLGLNIHMSTHTLRKTFCYHQMVMSGNDNRKLLLLQKMLGHSSPMQTLDYIGLSSEEIAEAYKGLNLGSRSNYQRLMDSSIIEYEERIG